MRRFDFVFGIGALLVLQACSATGRLVGSPPHEFVKVADCVGPASSLPDALAAALPPRTGNMQPDDQWADLAATIPGGFAGFFYDGAHRPVLMLTRPEAADSARHALDNMVPGSFPIGSAIVERARWDFLQLVNWYNYLSPRVFGDGVLEGDKDEVLNRIRYGVINSAARDQLVQRLLALHVPCDLVVIDSTTPAILLQR